MCSAKNKKASWATKLDLSSTTKDKKMIHFDMELHTITKKKKASQRSAKQQLCGRVEARNMEGSYASRAAKPLNEVYEHKEEHHGEGGDSEENSQDESDGTSRLRQRSFFLMHFDS
jgi:hypothetical protein